MDVRDTLTSLGFIESGGDMQEIWTSPRSPSGVWFEVTFEDVFSGTTTQWSRHTILIGQVIEPPATDLEIRALLERWGIATIACKCSYYAQDGELLMLGHLHHPSCEHADGSRERVAAKIIRDLVKGIDNWAADEDGDVHADCWEAYKVARYAIGQPVSEREETPAKGV